MPDGRRLHEAVAAEPCGGVPTFPDRPDDRMGVGRHVVQARPGALDRRLRGRRVAIRETLANVLDERLVHYLVARPPRRRLAIRESQACVAAAEVERRLL